MSDSKGKGKATAEPLRPDETPAPSAISNLISNVASSATGLARSAFAAPASNELNNTASSDLLGSGKAQSSSQNGGPSAYTEGSKLIAQSSTPPGASQAQSSQPRGFRTAQEHAQASEQEFSSFLDGIPILETDMSALEISSSAFSVQETALSDLYQPHSSQAIDDHPHPASRHVNPFSNHEFIRYSAHNSAGALKPSQREEGDRTYTTVQDAQAHDGADVLAILDDFNPNELDYFKPQTIEEEVEDWKLTPEQYDLAKKLAHELHLRPLPDHPSNLLPQAFQDEEKQEYLPEEYAFESFSHLGEVLPAGEAKEKWIEQWEGVLNRYQDEVWGGMAPLVKEAIVEVEQMKVEGTEGRQPKALARLGLVLGHISGVQQQVGTEKGKERERQRQRENELREAAGRAAHNVPVNYGTGGPSYIHARRMEESAGNASNLYPPPSESSRGDAMEDAWARSNYGPQVYMQPAEAEQAREYKTWFEKGVTRNER